MKPTNTPNFQVTAKEDGKQYWISRSVAVVAVPLWIHPQNGIYVPLGKRSQDMPLYPGHWGIPCGFLDWGESAADAVRREVYEELEVDLLEHTAIPDQPDMVISEPNPKENETVSLRFVIPVASDALPKLTATAEAIDVMWAEASKCVCRNDLAFNHAEIIQWAISTLDK